MMPLIAILAGVKTRNFQDRHTRVNGADARCLVAPGLNGD
jgi:hypothetical protein